MEKESRIVEGGSQAAQDIYVDRVCGRGGRYVDLGAGHYSEGSNTFQLEKLLRWSGIAAEIDETLRSDWSKHRPNTRMLPDAFDERVIESILAMGETGPIDYLSLDLEPPSLTLACLAGLPLDRVKFRVVTCEHDVYRSSRSVKNAMRGILEGYGYVRVVEDQMMAAIVEVEDRQEMTLVPVEDWWVHPDLVDLQFASDEARKIRYQNERVHALNATEFNRRQKGS